MFKQSISTGAAVFSLMVIQVCGQIVTPPPSITAIAPPTNGQFQLFFNPYPAAFQYKIFGTSAIGVPLAEDTTGAFAYTNFSWSRGLSGNGFFELQVTPLNSNAVLTATVLNRLAYGPTPDLLAQLLQNNGANSAQAYIQAQLAPETINETLPNAHTNLAFIATKLVGAGGIVTSSSAGMQDLRAWHVLRGVSAQRQLLEILLQFLENHFVTQYSKSSTYFNAFYNGDGGVLEDRVATQLEFRENDAWRQALLNPTCTFSNLLTISAESPAMIIYLDTVTSRGDGKNVANENYARELMELFTMGVNNGYDQTDVTTMSRCWTGWYVEKVDPTNAFNPFAAAQPGLKSTNNGVWAFNFRQDHHGTNSKSIFIGKTVPARFGAPWAGRPYELDIPIRTGTNGIQDGFDVVGQLCNLPFTEEFISVKLCCLFVHDNFAIGYDFTDPNLSPEGQLVKQCMLAWENGNPQGQIRAVLGTIFSSALFQGNGAAFQKVKTPLEFTISTIRALRTSTSGINGAPALSADTDGYSISGTSPFSGSAPLARMGSMLLFDRTEPNGYPEAANGWISGGTLAERLRFVQSVLTAAGQSGKSDSGNNNTSDPLGLLQVYLPVQTPPGSTSNDANVVDFILGILFPGEGTANLGAYRAAALKYLNTDDFGNPSPFGSLTVSRTPGSTYDNRLRGMVAMLLTLPRFQEQ